MLFRSYQGVLNAVKEGVIAEERINESLKRIYRVKLRDRIDAEGNVVDSVAGESPEAADGQGAESNDGTVPEGETGAEGSEGTVPEGEAGAEGGEGTVPEGA